MKKKINHRLWSIFSLIALLFPLIASVGQASTVVAATVETAKVTLHKRVGVTGNHQNTGSVMDFDGTALNGVTFQAFDVTEEYYRLRGQADHVNTPVEEIYDLLKSSANITQGTPPSITYGANTLGGAYKGSQTTAGEGTAVFGELPKKSGGKDAVYLFHESDSPETVTDKEDVVLGFPVYEFAGGVYTDNELSDIHLYPKNEQASGGMELVKTTDTLAGKNIPVAGATFVIHRIRDNVEQWVTGIDDSNGEIIWGTKGNAFEFVTDAAGKFITTPYTVLDENGVEISSHNFKFAAGDYLVSEIAAPTGMVIPESAINHPFTIDPNTNTAEKIEIKNDTPDIEKELDVDNNDFTVGQEIPFKINFLVPSGIADTTTPTSGVYRYTEFNIVDTPSDNLAYVAGQTATLWAGETQVTDLDFRIVPSATDGGFTVYFNDDEDSTAPDLAILGKYASQTLTLKFNMVLTSNAVPDEKEENKPTLNWTNDSTKEYKDGDEVEVITYGHKFSKIDAVTGATLNGAQFVVQKGEGSDALYCTGDIENLWVAAPDDDEDETWENLGVKIYTSDADGLVTVSGLAAGD